MVRPSFSFFRCVQKCQDFIAHCFYDWLALKSQLFISTTTSQFYSQLLSYVSRRATPSWRARMRAQKQKSADFNSHWSIVLPQLRAETLSFSVLHAVQAASVHETEKKGGRPYQINIYVPGKGKRKGKALSYSCIS